MLYFDEAGYTGADLTNKEQQIFTLASTNLTEDEIEYIKKVSVMKNGVKNYISNPCILIHREEVC